MKRRKSNPSSGNSDLAWLLALGLGGYVAYNAFSNAAGMPSSGSSGSSIGEDVGTLYDFGTGALIAGLAGALIFL